MSADRFVIADFSTKAALQAVIRTLSDMLLQIDDILQMDDPKTNMLRQLYNSTACGNRLDGLGPSDAVPVLTSNFPNAKLNDDASKSRVITLVLSQTQMPKDKCEKLHAYVSAAITKSATPSLLRIANAAQIFKVSEHALLVALGCDSVPTIAIFLRRLAAPSCAR
jgi:hypothetical protein